MRDHGTKACYVFGPEPGGDSSKGCRCDDCRAAIARYERDRARRIEPAYVGADPARKHIEWLGEQGVGLKRVAKAAGISHGALSKLMYGERGRGRGPSKRIRKTTLDAILAVTADAVADGARVDAGTTWARIDRMVAAGVTKKSIARRLGQQGPGLQLSKRSIEARHARAIAEMAAEFDAGTLVVIRGSKWGDKVVAPPANDEPAPEADGFDVVTEGNSRSRILLPLVELLEARIDHASWRQDAACRGRAPWMFFPSRGDHRAVEAAKKVCGACFVRQQCLDAHMDERDGIYGGLSSYERRALRRDAAS